ncbi:RluA family pseudouridine synthase [Eisenibacter elegans]|jgi:23S rRNA pseudouridine955/2504/2580 synthase|uniref:RluA family pseudouridine synthase n=1 Tax=Eisenibacter elegans TaxID=997 RepID=UPI00047CDCA4|nr:RluA family pseudouridine synthase [Eisenibacter elegans]
MKPINFKDLILFEDEDYVLINKPPYISTLQDRAPEGKQSLIELARDYVATAQMGHRLDKETSGVLAIAKNPEAYRHLSLQFEHREIAKLYHAVVEGVQEFDNICVNLPILPLRTGKVKIDTQEGKEAMTFFRTLQMFRHHTLVECRPITGRMHQIRIHLAVLKAPIVADEAYGGQHLYLSQIKRKGFNMKQTDEEQPLIQRVVLHARSLLFKRMNGEEISVEAPYPKDIRALLNQLEKHSG